MTRGTEFSMNNRSQRVFVPMLGRHSAVNALAAIAIGRALRLPEEAIIESLAKSESPQMRLELQVAGDITILNDAYNANPNSMRAAIETLASLETSGRRVAVLGDMLELGAVSERYHREIGTFAAAAGRLDLLVCVGAQARHLAAAAVQAGLAPGAVKQFDDASAAAAGVPGMLTGGDLVLLKASRGIHSWKRLPRQSWLEHDCSGSWARDGSAVRPGRYGSALRLGLILSPGFPMPLFFLQSLQELARNPRLARFFRVFRAVTFPGDVGDRP